MTDYTISSKLSNETVYAYYHGRFWRWDGSIWKESHFMTQKFERAKAADKKLTPQTFLTNSAEFAPLDEYEIDCAMLDALENAKPCKNAPIEPVKEESECQTSTPAASPAKNSSVPAANADSSSVAPAVQSMTATEAVTFDFGADDQTNALLLQDAQTFITGNMARIMAAKHAHDLTANHYQGSWGKWCAAIGISRDTGDNMVRVAEQFGNIQLEGKSILDVQPMKLLYAAAKPSTPAELVAQVKSGDITTHKQYQEALAQIKAEKDRANAAEAERDKLLGAQNRAAWAESHIQDVEAQRDAALADVQGLTEQNAKASEAAAAKSAAEAKAATGFDPNNYYSKTEADQKFGTPYTLPAATSTALGGVKLSEDFTADEDGTLHLAGGTAPDPYPVGSIYQSTDAASPAALFGGTWEQIAENRVLMGASGTHAAATTAEAGLPNITGSMVEGTADQGPFRTEGYLICAGAFRGVKKSNAYAGHARHAGENYDLYFDASASNAVYGASDTVQPPAYYVHIWRRVA